MDANKRREEATTIAPLPLVSSDITVHIVFANCITPVQVSSTATVDQLIESWYSHSTFPHSSLSFTFSDKVISSCSLRSRGIHELGIVDTCAVHCYTSSSSPLHIPKMKQKRKKPPVKDMQNLFPITIELSNITTITRGGRVVKFPSRLWR
jgi:hypothetical protein